MRLLVRLGHALGVIVLAGLTAPAAQAAYSGHQDPVWPCMAIKVPDLSLAAVQAGPPVDAYMKTWSKDQEVATLAERRPPLNEAKAEVTTFAKELGQDREPKLLAPTAGLFIRLNGERSGVIAGLHRFGARQTRLAGQIRHELDKLHETEGKPNPDEQQITSLVSSSSGRPDCLCSAGKLLSMSVRYWTRLNSGFSHWRASFSSS
jgi:hypothetical protein